MIIGSDRIPCRCYAKLFRTWDPDERVLRLGRLVYARGDGPGCGKGYSAKLSLALTPRWFAFRREYEGWLLVLLGVRIHHQKSYGGWTV